MPYAKWRPFCLDLDVITILWGSTCCVFPFGNSLWWMVTFMCEGTGCVIIGLNKGTKPFSKPLLTTGILRTNFSWILNENIITIFCEETLFGNHVVCVKSGDHFVSGCKSLADSTFPYTIYIYIYIYIYARGVWVPWWSQIRIELGFSEAWPKVYHNESAHQIWAKPDRCFVRKCAETADVWWTDERTDGRTDGQHHSYTSLAFYYPQGAPNGGRHYHRPGVYLQLTASRGRYAVCGWPSDVTTFPLVDNLDTL